MFIRDSGYEEKAACRRRARIVGLANWPQVSGKHIADDLAEKMTVHIGHTSVEEM